ncbi:hypothetical protein SAMN04489844_0520 [Nocardioides exalbidus]|uniref:SurA N-terminal domain-containing protein n=1 Tax=Nocardioides exalbidus TaxID=402596 RepID=A0A1H4KCU9_9ACTN|nr:hypothetical protein [Nocardioides exalbidus]SEB55868.1 hypothetical protein SAMN04489844_0520 [Nocardioides exalbidus]
MRQQSKSRARLVTAVTTLGAGLLLTGCGSASPGIAARVGDEELTVRQVDQTAEEMCTALGDQFASSSTVLPMSFIRQGTVQLLTLRAQALQIADDYGIEPGSSYENAVAQSRGTTAAMPEDVRDTYLELNTANALATDIVNQIGAIVLEDNGVADPTDEEITQAGADAFNQWPDANGVDIDPRYGLESVDGVLTPVDTNTSFAVSDIAKSGLTSEPDASYSATLPLTQRCG